MKNTLIALFLLFTHTTMLSQDWANLTQYQAANAELIPGEHPVIFMGNSITEGWVNAMPEFFTNNGYLGRGISGQTTPQMLLRFRQDVIALKPKVVVILAGTNDIAGNTGPMTLAQVMDNVKSKADLASANGIKVIIASVLQSFDYSWAPEKQPNLKIPELNKMIKTYCAGSMHHYLDYFSAMVGDKNDLRAEITYDGVHPNKIGYEIMAPLASMTIGKVLGQ